MALNEKEKSIIRATLLTVGQERLRLQEHINGLVKEAIKLRTVAVELEETFDRLSDLLSSTQKIEKTLSDLGQKGENEQ